MDVPADPGDNKSIRFFHKEDSKAKHRSRTVDVLNKFAGVVELGNLSDPSADRKFYLWVTDRQFSILQQQHAEMVIAQWLAPIPQISLAEDSPPDVAQPEYRPLIPRTAL